MKSKVSIALIKREWLITRYNFDIFTVSLLSSLLSFFIFFLILDSHITSDETLMYGVIIITTVMTVGVSDYLLIKDDFNSGVLEQLFLLPFSSPFKIVLIKWLFSFLKYITINSTFWYFIWKVFFNTNFFYFNYIIFVLHITSVSLFAGSISLSIKKNSLTNILIIPITFPQIILSVMSLKSPTYLLLISALDLIMIPIFIIFSTFIIQGAIRDNG